MNIVNYWRANKGHIIWCLLHPITAIKWHLEILGYRREQRRRLRVFKRSRGIK